VVTGDRALQARVTHVDALAVGPTWLLDRL
jgi:hypothetical protein